jgi:hypothetical protein
MKLAQYEREQLANDPRLKAQHKIQERRENDKRKLEHLTLYDDPREYATR